MPYLKSISLHTTVNRSLSYILNPDKTEDLLYTNAVNCLPNAKEAYLMMKTVYEHFSSHKFDEPLPKQGKGRVKAIHYIQSFDPKDNIAPELAHKIARTFARKAFGDSCQVVIATHNDKAHVHNHIIINSYGIDGRKFNANKKTLDELKEISDRVCLAFGIKPFDKSKATRTTVAYNEWQNEQRGTSWKQKIRLEIDGLVLKVKNVDELLAELEMLGYTVRRGKYISIKAPEQQRAVRLKTLGEDYTIESLASRILWRDVGAGLNNPCERSALRDKYSETIDGIQAVNANHPTLEQLGAMLTVINRDNLRSIGEVEGKIRQLEYEVEKARQKLNALAAQQDTLTGLAEQAEEYFSLLDKAERTPAEELRLKMHKTVLESNNIVSRSDFEYLKSVIAETKKKAASLNESFERCRQLYELYSEITKTYNEISKGDYISRLLEEELKSRAKPRRSL